MRRARDLALETLALEQEGRVLTARYGHPPFNYMTDALLRELEELTRVVDEDDSVGAVVLTGRPPERFITHFDVSELLESSERAGRSFPEPATRAGLRAVEAAELVPGGERAIEGLPVGGVLSIRRFAEIVLRIRRSGTVYVAAINGPCAGGGMELTLSFDVRLAADSGVLLGLPELLIGLTTSVGGQRLVQLLGPARALELMLEGRLLEPDEALAAGLVSQVTPRADLLATAQERAARYATRSSLSVAAQKRILFEHALRSPAESLRREGAASLAATTSEPTRQALRAFVDAQERAGGDSPFLVEGEAWVEGRRSGAGP